MLPALLRKLDITPFLPTFRWRRGAVRTRAELTVFLAEQAAFTVQKTAYGYCRARAGKQQEKLEQEAGFIERMEPCRWPTAAAVLADMILWLHDRHFRPVSGHDAVRLHALLPDLYAACLAALGSPPAESGVSPDWQEARARFADRLSAPRPSGADPCDLTAAFESSYQVLLATLPFRRDILDWDQQQIRHTFRLWVVHHADRLASDLDATALLLDLGCLSDQATPTATTRGAA